MRNGGELKGLCSSCKMSKKCKTDTKPIKQNIIKSNETSIVDRDLDISFVFQTINDNPAVIITIKRLHRIRTCKFFRINNWTPNTHVIHYVIENEYKIEIQFFNLHKCHTVITRVTKSNNEIFYKIQTVSLTP